MNIALPAGTRLSLHDGDWAAHDGQPGTVGLDVRVVDIGGKPAAPGWIRVRGHLPECRRKSGACAEPWCVEIIARVEAVYDATNR